MLYDSICEFFFHLVGRITGNKQTYLSSKVQIQMEWF